tara:strand:+ start:188 stop:370 length:183 start_codon:yes stop_codon:yes gene_type:complete
MFYPRILDPQEKCFKKELKQVWRSEPKPKPEFDLFKRLLPHTDYDCDAVFRHYKNISKKG